MFKNKKILVTGGTGLIGQSLIKQLKRYNPQEIRVVSLDKNTIDGTIHYPLDLTHLDCCNIVCKDIDYVFNLVGVKGNPRMTQEKPASFSVPMIQFNTNMMNAARLANVKWFLYTSSIGVYSPAPLLREDDVWTTMPSKNDWFSGWAKRSGELVAEATNIEYGLNNISIVRPANVYGEYDNFNPNTAMVVPSLIARICSGENPLKVWGDGEQIRDIIHADDVARGMIHMVENKITKPVNLGSGNGVLIKELVEIIVDHYHALTDKLVSVVYDTSKPSGDPIRLMDTTRAKSYGFECKTSLNKGILQTMKWYLENKQVLTTRYEPFKT